MAERADKFKAMQQALAAAGIERAPGMLAVFERGDRKTPVVGRVVGVGLVDEITDRHYIVIDGVEPRPLCRARPSGPRIRSHTHKTLRRPRDGLRSPGQPARLSRSGSHAPLNEISHQRNRLQPCGIPGVRRKEPTIGPAFLKLVGGGPT